MDQLIAQAAAFLEVHPQWVIAVATLAAFGESLVIVGIFIPGTTLLALIGGMAGAGLVDPVPLALGGIVGAVVGDTITYYLGRWAGRPILRWKVLRPHRRRVAEARLFFRRYGVWSVLIGRFFGPLRATVPLVAGAFEMRAVLFQFANITSALIWAPAVMAPGWLAARGVGGLSGINWSGWLVAGIGITLVIAAGGFLALRWLLRRQGGSASP